MVELKFGSRGDAVKALQISLNRFGYGLVVDGSFGLNTKRAVLDFQSKNGLIRDGVFGLATMNALNSSMDYTYKQHSNGLHTVTIDPLELKLHMEVTTGARIQLKNAMNASFVWWHDAPKNTKSYPISSLVYDGKSLQNIQPHGVPTPTFIVYKDGRVSVSDVKSFSPTEISKIHFAVAGVDLIPIVRENGFSPFVNFSSVAYATNRIAIGYDKNLKKVVLAYHKYASASKMSSLMKSIGCELAVSLDSGGSANFKVNGKIIRGSSRYMSAWITW